MDIVWCATNNLCLRSVIRTIRGWIRGKLLVAVLIATPCASFSTARNKPGGPRALRTADWPGGLPDLAGADLQKVRAGNSLAYASFSIFMECRRHNIPVLIENPAYSWLWKLPAARNCAKQPGVPDAYFDMCALKAPWHNRTRVRTWGLDLSDWQCLCKSRSTCAFSDRPHLRCRVPVRLDLEFSSQN